MPAREEERKETFAAWERAVSTFERDLRALDLDPEETGEIMGAVKTANLLMHHAILSIWEKEGGQA